jgi:CRISPR/Cas system-associated protein Cas10 (large subunit of type III CRISPR-Cas system)
VQRYMLKLIESKEKSTFENIYDKHSAILYGIILKISKNTKEAEEILIESFKTYFLQTAKPENNDRVFLHLLRITISTASEKINLSKQNIGKIILDDLKSNTATSYGFKFQPL